MKIGQIEKGIDIKKAWVSQYPFKHMEVGDSFLLTADDETPRRLIQRIQPTKNKAQKIYGTQYKAHEVEDGVRVWRIK